MRQLAPMDQRIFAVCQLDQRRKQFFFPRSIILLPLAQGVQFADERAGLWRLDNNTQRLQVFRVVQLLDIQRIKGADAGRLRSIQLGSASMRSMLICSGT